MGFFEKLKNGLTKTKESLNDKVDKVLSVFVKVDEELFEELEEVLIMADVGVKTTQEIIENLKEQVKLKRITDGLEVKNLLKQEIEKIFEEDDNKLKIETKPSVIVVIGVNGVGKTTSIGKLAVNLKNQGKKVMLVAGDTFRAGAIEQLEVWSKRAECKIVKKEEGRDPASVIFDAISEAKKEKTDVLICDTAGRLHNKKNLMDELKKIYKTIKRELPDSDCEVLLVLDATTGQNAVTQATEFKEISDITGIILTKLDGTAKGGIVISIKSELKIPVKYVGLGEQIEDLQEFNSKDFVKAIFE